MKKLINLAFIFISTLGFAQIPDPLPGTYINDYAKIFTADQLTSLNQTIGDIENKSGVQLAVVIINNLPANVTIENYTLQLSQKWHVGNNKTGMVYVAALLDHKQRLQIASSLDTIFTLQKNLEILNALKPSLKSKDYYGSLQILIGQVETTLAVQSLRVPPKPVDVTSPQVQQQTQQQPVTDQKDHSPGIAAYIVIFIAIAVIWLIIRLAIRRSRPNDNPNQNNATGPDSAQYIDSDNAGSFGGGGLLGGILGAFAVNELLDDDSPNDQQVYDDDDDRNRRNNNNNDNDSGSSWGDWGSNDSSSSDSGFSSDDSSSSSSDW